MKENLTVSALDTYSLSESQIRQISEVEKDMWAFWIGEYVKCNCCWKIHSKKDIFWHLSAEIRRESVVRLEELHISDSISCKQCESTNTEFIYDVAENMKAIVDRYRNSVASYLSVLHDSNWDIVGFWDLYIDSFEWIYSREFNSYYGNWIYNQLSEFLDWYSMILYFSSIWTINKYISLREYFSIMNNLLFSVSDEFSSLPWITELEESTNLKRLHTSLWVRNIFDVWTCPNRNNNSEFWIYFINKFLDEYRKWYSMWYKKFMKQALTYH